MLLEEFDNTRAAVIEPYMVHHPVEGFPETVVSIFHHTLFHSIAEFLGGQKIAETKDVDGHWPVYEVTYKGKRFALLDKSIQDCGIIIPTRAIRDEGTSYHYAPANDYINVNKKYIPEFIEVLDQFGYPYVIGTTWTTDAFYRETRDKVNRRKEMGAICVEMECSAMQAMCDFRGVEYFQFLYAGDNLDHSTWDPRSLSGTARLDDKEKIALLAFELAVKIEERVK